jgi:hypothetical protein
VVDDPARHVALRPRGCPRDKSLPGAGPLAALGVAHQGDAVPVRLGPRPQPPQAPPRSTPAGSRRAPTAATGCRSTRAPAPRNRAEPTWRRHPPRATRPPIRRARPPPAAARTRRGRTASPPSLLPGPDDARSWFRSPRISSLDTLLPLLEAPQGPGRHRTKARHDKAAQRKGRRLILSSLYSTPGQAALRTFVGQGAPADRFV